ncbi:MAG: hypothetical protein M3Y84_12765 [Acidobacteriota bacterium]|nr:hypothetical protein [Acidobacteriota bacterium]
MNFLQAMDPDGDTINVYYRAADCSSALARSNIDSLLARLDAHASLDRRRAQDA